MKFNVLRSILMPWILFFLLSVTILVLASLKLPVQFQDPRFRQAVLYVGGFLCLLMNFSTMNKAGIWIAESLPYSVRNSSFSWLMRAVLAVVIALVFFLIGQASWMPLYWQGFVIPFVFMISIFVAARSLLGLILKSAAKVTFIRLFIVVMSLPLLFGVGLTAMFLSQSIVTSYEASQPEMVPKYLKASDSLENAKPLLAEQKEKQAPNGVSKRAKQLQAAVEKGQSCAELDKEVRNALDPKMSEDIAYWGVRAVKCIDMKSAIIMPRLVDLMIKHKSTRVKAAAIEAMSKFSRESIKQVSYILVKHINEGEPKEVIQAAATVLSKMGIEERASATKRLRSLLDSPENSLTAAEILVDVLDRADLVQVYVADHLKMATEARGRAVAMICLLPEGDRAVATQFISDITAAIKQGRTNDPAMEALACMGPAGLQAVRLEVQNPQRLPRPLAAQALAEMDLKNDAETLKIVESCLSDKNEEVRKWCSHSMGKIGRIALPRILDLLKSKDPEQLEAGHLALDSMNDPDAKDDLRRVRAENSGWMANRKNLQVASAVSTALVRIENKR